MLGTPKYSDASAESKPPNADTAGDDQNFCRLIGAKLDNTAFQHLRDKIVAGEGAFPVTPLEDKRGVFGEIFSDDKRFSELAGWVNTRNGKVNLYEHINPVRLEYIHSPDGKKGKKAALIDIDRVVRLHVDLDPRENYDLEDERKLILALLTDEDRLRKLGLPGGPTTILDSGGGYWAFWELLEPIQLPSVREARASGNEGRVLGEAARDVGRYNEWITRQLNGELGGKIADGCFNIDRIARLVGTVNLPDETKIAKGRKPVVAKFVGYWPERAYRAEQFKKTNSDITNFSTKKERASVKLEFGAPVFCPLGEDAHDYVRRIGDQYDLGEETIRKILLGDGYSDDERDRSRSGVFHNVMLACLRKNVPHDVLAGIVTDERLACSAEVLNTKKHKLSPQRYVEGWLKKNLTKFEKRRAEEAAEQMAADRAFGGEAELLQPEAETVEFDGVGVTLENTAKQIKDADAKYKGDGLFTPSQWLKHLNNNHCVLLREGGITLVLSWDVSEIDETRVIPVMQTFASFKDQYMNKTVNVGTSSARKDKQVGKFWLEHGGRKQYTALRFLPGKPLEVSGYLNLWRGWGVEEKAGDWSLMRAHIREVLADGDEASDDYILKWSAWAVQNPDQPAEAALVFKGGKGAGKGAYGRAMRRLLGQHGLQIHSQQHLVGRFNTHLRDCCLLFADEAIAADDKKAESVLKGLITEPDLPVEGKGKDVIQARNHLHVIMASNDDWVVPASADERRFAVFNVSDRFTKNDAYFTALENQMKYGGLSAMLYDLKNMDLGNWHPRRNIPNTKALQEQKALSRTPFQEAMFEILDSGILPGVRMKNFENAVFSGDIGSTLGLYTRMREISPKLKDQTETALARFLHSFGDTAAPETLPTKKRDYCGGKQYRGWQFPSLAVMRATWEKKHGPVEWASDGTWAEDRDDPTGGGYDREMPF